MGQFMPVDSYRWFIVEKRFGMPAMPPVMLDVDVESDIPILSQAYQEGMNRFGQAESARTTERVILYKQSTEGHIERVKVWERKPGDSRGNANAPATRELRIVKPDMDETPGS